MHVEVLSCSGWDRCTQPSMTNLPYVRGECRPGTMTVWSSREGAVVHGVHAQRVVQDFHRSGTQEVPIAEMGLRNLV